jgi:hypothetical protein
MAAAHLLAASTSSSTAAAAFQPPLRLCSPTHPPPHLRLNRTGTYDAPSSLSAASTVRWGSKAKFDRSPDALLGASPPFAGRRPFPVVRAVETDATKDGESLLLRAPLYRRNETVVFVCFDPFFNSLSIGLPLLLLMRVVGSVAQRSPRPRRRRRRRRTAPASTSCSASRAPRRRP